MHEIAYAAHLTLLTSVCILNIHVIFSYFGSKDNALIVCLLVSNLICLLAWLYSTVGDTDTRNLVLVLMAVIALSHLLKYCRHKI